MKKKMRYVATGIVLLATLLFTGCNKETAKDEVSTPVSVENTQTEVVEAKRYVVTFYDQDGITELSKVEVKEGELASEYVPAKDGVIFQGWFGTTTLNNTVFLHNRLPIDVLCDNFHEWYGNKCIFIF